MIKYITQERRAPALSLPLYPLKSCRELGKIELLTHQTNCTDNRISEKAKQNYTFYLSKTIPGIGDILALTILYGVGNISRFPNTKEFSSYCRVAPGIHHRLYSLLRPSLQTPPMSWKDLFLKSCLAFGVVTGTGYSAS